MTRRGWLALLPILLWMQSGCLWTAETERTSWLKRFNNQAIQPDHARLQVALIERPLGDDYLDRLIWDHADELIVDDNRRGSIEKNGFRVGQLVGAPPSTFQQLLLSPASCTSKAMIFPTGRAMSIEVGPIRARTAYSVVSSKMRSEVVLQQAGFMLEVIASFTSEGTKLTFTPKVENDEARLPFTARPDQSTWERTTGRANRRYAEMSWEVTLKPNQYLLIGGRPNNEGTIGQATFAQKEAGVQRLLVIRNCRPLSANDASEATLDEMIRIEKSTPLALQAAILR